MTLKTTFIKPEIEIQQVCFFKQLGKDGLILEGFSLWLHPTKNVPNHYSEHDVQYFCIESTENKTYVPATIKSDPIETRLQ